MAFPDWVQKQKRVGYEIKCIRGHYYMYKLGSKWDSQKGRPKKKSGEYIGKVTPDGVVPKKARVDKAAPVFALECGASSFLMSVSEDLLTELNGLFPPDVAGRVYVAALLRLASRCPFCRVGDHYETSWMSRIFPGLALSPASVTGLLDIVGGNRAACAEFMRKTMGDSPYILIDGTRTTTASAGIVRAMPGHSKTKKFLPQINQVYVMAISDGEGAPAFYRNVAGNIPDVTALEYTMEDARLSGATFIADTGFASVDNFMLLEDSGLDHIVPLKRNTAEVDLATVHFDEVFSFHHRTILAHSEKKDGYRVIVYRDEKLRSDEMTDFVERVEKANATKLSKKGFDPDKDALRDVSSETMDRTADFGAIVIRTSLMDTPAQEVYETYKMRWQIEQLFDTMRNVCDNDASYMHDDTGFEAWSFIGHISLIVACRVLSLLKKKKLSKQWSLSGILDNLSRVHAVQIADEWKIAETTKKTRELIAKLGFAMPC